MDISCITIKIPTTSYSYTCGIKSYYHRNNSFIQIFRDDHFRFDLIFIKKSKQTDLNKKTETDRFRFGFFR